MKQQYKLNERKRIRPYSPFTMDWRFNDCVRVCLGDNRLGYRELFSVVLSTFTDGQIYCPQGASAIIEELSMDGNENLGQDILSLMLECSCYSAYERRVIDALKKKLDDEAGIFLTEFALRDASAVNLFGLRECLNGHLHQWYNINIIQPVTQLYIDKLIKDGFLVSEFETEEGIPACIFSLVESEFNKRCTALLR